MCSAHRFSAIKTTLLALPELVTEIIYPAALESRFQFAEDISDMREQLRKQVHRILELRVKKVEEPGAFCRNVLRVLSFRSSTWMQMHFTAQRTLLCTTSTS
jgi:hypothetical protein